MNAGLQIWDEFGNIVLDATYRVLRIIDSVPMDGSNGSRIDSRLKQGGFVSFQPQKTCGDGFLSGGVITPRFSIDPNTGMLSWSYAPMHNTSYDIYQIGILFYGAS